MLKIKQLCFPEFLNACNFFTKIITDTIIEVETLPEENRNPDVLYLEISSGDYYRWNTTISGWIKEEHGPIEEYLLKENNTITEEQYYSLNESERTKYVTIDTKGDIPIYKVTNGVLSKLVFIDNEPFYEFYSPNLIPYDFCYKIAIHSLPGNKFIFNDNVKNIIKIGPSGVFNMDFGNDPIFSVRLLDNNSYMTYPTIIDIIYQTAEEEVK